MFYILDCQTLRPNAHGIWKNIFANKVDISKEDELVILQSAGVKNKKLDPKSNLLERKSFEEAMAHMYIFGRDTLFELDIQSMQPAKDLRVVRKLEKEGVKKQLKVFTTTINLVK